MINRLKAVWQQRREVIIFALIALLYSLGGGGWLLLRRYAMPLVIVLAAGKGIWPRLLAFVCLSFPLHLGYTDIVDPEKWLLIAGLGILYGLGFLPLLKKETIHVCAMFALIWPAAVWQCHYNAINWQWVEYALGMVFGYGYLLTKEGNHGR